MTTLSYPESGWISVCGSYFPSEVQWLYKTFDGINQIDGNKIPLYSNSAYRFGLSDVVTTVGTGQTTDGIPIEEQVGMDWLKYAIQKRFWSLLYKQERITATQAGMTMFKNELIYVLDLAVSLEMLTDYTITSSSLDRENCKVAFTFTATFTHTILSAKVSGSLYK